MADLDDFLREIEASIADLRARLEPLESGLLRIAEIREGKQIDTTEAHILWYKREIATYEAIATRIRSGEFK